MIHRALSTEAFQGGGASGPTRSPRKGGSQPGSGQISTATGDNTDAEWWRAAVIYQVYPRSFRDSDGDGIGDIEGIRSRLAYLAELGIDAIWISPWYPSPMADTGYDVSNYRDVDPTFGVLSDAEALIDDAHRLGLRVLLDVVPNHTSNDHRWFQAALAASPGSPERDKYIFRDGRGPRGDEPPNNWLSRFGGAAWSRVRQPSGEPGQWYLHLYSPQQPDLNWMNREIREDFDGTLRFWFDRGVDGFRIDVAQGLAKAPGLPDVDVEAEQSSADYDHPHWDRDEAKEVFRAWRSIGNSYSPQRVFVAEAWVSPSRLVRYLGPSLLHSAFNFGYLLTPWRAQSLREAIDTTLTTHETVGASATWVLSNHDVPREVSRFAREPTDRPVRRLEDLASSPVDLVKGRRRARAAALLMLALPGSAYIYQGQELGLPEVEDLPIETRQDPIVRQSGGLRLGRDGCRVPIPWAGDSPPYDFSPAGAHAEPWLPQPSSWGDLTVAAQAGDPSSTLELYRTALRLRRSLQQQLQGDRMHWRAAPTGVLAFDGESGFVCMVNISDAAINLPIGAEVLLASEDLVDAHALQPDTAAWIMQASLPADEGT